MMDMMIMYFHQRVREHILFEEWFPTTETQFVLSCFGVAALGLLLELFKTFRLALYRRADNFSSPEGCCSADFWTSTTAYGATLPTGEGSACECSSEDADNSILNYKPYSAKFLLDRNHQVQVLLYFLQAFFTYSLMLVAMTYNTALFLSLMAGHTIGYFLTAPLFLPIEKIRIGDCCCG